MVFDLQNLRLVANNLSPYLDKPNQPQKQGGYTQNDRLRGNGPSGEIRTPGPLVPNQMRYQAALHSDAALISPLIRNFKHSSNA